MPFANQPDVKSIPPKLNKWSWGAFFMNWIWGLGNSTYIALLMFVPFVNIIMFFVLGAKGSKWAWKNRIWEDEAHFVKTQRNWAIAGAICWLALPLLIAGLVFGIMGSLTSSGAYRLSLAKAAEDKAVIAIFGEPIDAGWLTTGKVQISGSKGRADLSIPISGPKCSGDVISRSEKLNGEWVIHLLAVKADCNNDTIVLINTKSVPIPGQGKSI